MGYMRKEGMRITRLARWLLVAVLLTGCSRAALPPTGVSRSQFPTAEVVALAAAHPAAAPAPQQDDAAPKGGAVTSPEPALPAPVAAAAAAGPTATVPDASAATSPSASAPAPGAAAPGAALPGAESSNAAAPAATAPAATAAAASPSATATTRASGIPTAPAGPTIAPSATTAATATAATLTVTTAATAAPATVSTPSAPAAAATSAATTTAARWSTDPHPLQIEVMRKQAYPAGPITFEQTLNPGANYSRYIVSYRSDGYKVYALMTVPDGTGPNGTGPNGTKPATGWPVIVFNHGYIAPAEYRSTERYVAYVDYIARNGYIVFMSDYRGWANSEGGDSVVGGGYGSPALTVDVLAATAALKAYKDADPDRIGMWGHSMGGQLTLRAMVVSKDIKAGVIWGGVVAPYPDVIARWGRLGRATPTPQAGSPTPLASPTQLAPPAPTPVPAGTALSWTRSFGGWVQEFSAKYGTAAQNPVFWATISPNTYLADLSGPVQLHHSTTDEMVPLAWSQTLDKELKASARQPYEFYSYPGDNHNINANFNVAMQRTVAFFDKYVKGR